MKNTNLYKLLISDANIYKAILSINSYIFNPQLLDDKDLELYYELRDKFNYDKYFCNGFIDEIREIIIKILEKPKELFTTKVYFKIKKPKEGIYRPLHVANLKDNIAIVAMLQVLIYDMSSSNETKIKLSNLAKIIPSNFYGNIPSKLPERLFERWQEKYKQYSEKANEKFSEYENTNKYKFEVTLDLKNFFPSINPLLVYDFIIKALEIKFNDKELELIKIITFKLLYFKIEAYEDDNFRFFKQLYYTNTDETKKFNEIKCTINKKTVYITKGIPQGLPQAYFFGNLIMVKVSEIYDKCFKGEALYYVDDSYIYTDCYLDDQSFKDKLLEINNELKKYSFIENIEKQQICELPFEGIFDGLKKDDNNKKYVIKVHTEDKSSYLSVNDTKTGYKYLKFLSRLASMGSFDFKTTFSDLEETHLKNKFSTLIKAIEKEIALCCKGAQIKRGCNRINSDTNDNKCKMCKEKKKRDCNEFNAYKEYFDKLKRFKRFFEFRKLMIEIEESDKAIEKILLELENFKKDKIEEVEGNLNEKLFEIKLNIIDNYIMSIVDDFDELLKYDNKKLNKIRKLYDKIKDFEICCSNKFKDNKDNKKYFYYYKIFNYNRQISKINVDPYKSICKIISKKINLKHKHHEYQMTYLKELSNAIQKNQIVEYAFDTYCCESKQKKDSTNIKFNEYSDLIQYDINEGKKRKYEIFRYWSVKSKYLRRQILNTIISLILNIELNENLYITNCGKKTINYFELRLAIAARNAKLDISLINKILREYFRAKQIRTLDYTIFQSIYYFRLFAREPKYIDNLILIHKYTTELWENGSKYMHFYTLHNQEHAVELIKNINKLVKAIDYLKISKIDYYILYIACYLHDISMVIYPDQERFLMKDWNAANLIYMSFREKMEELKKIGMIEQYTMKKLLLDIYEKIDNLFENEVRNNHVRNSAKYIRNSKDLLFIDESILDIVACVSYSHGMDTRDVYHIKSSAKNNLISKKIMMILIRLADLFDMSEGRVSMPLFYNNKENMSSTNKFHWISHLITGNFKIINKYSVKNIHSNDNNPSYFKPGSIQEKIIIEIDVNLSQLTTINNLQKCDMVCMEDYKMKDEVVLHIQNKKKKCKQKKCNFVCKWFMKKNAYIINELYYLQNYLADVQNYFETSFDIKLKLNDSSILRAEDFDDLKKYISNN